MKPRDWELLDRRFPPVESHKLPPQNIEAEQSVLGAMLIENSVILLAREILEPDDFYRDAHRKIFSAMADLLEHGIAVDLVTLTNELRKRDQLDAIGGASYIASLLEATPTAANIKHYAAIVKEKAVRRDLIKGATEIITSAYGDEEELDFLFARHQRMLFELMKKSASEESIQKLEVVPDALRDYFSSCRETPFESLNRAIEGFMVGELITIEGRAGMGKTALALEFLKHTAIQEGCPVIYFGAQMTKEKIYARLLASICRVPLRKIMGGKIKKEETEIIKKLAAAHEVINAVPIHREIIEEKISVPSLIAAVMNLIETEIKEAPGLVIIENMQQLFWPSKKEFKSEQEKREEAELIRNALRQFSYQIKAPVIVSDQVTQEVDKREDKRPLASDSKRGGKTEELADTIIAIYRPNYYEKKPIAEEGRPEPGELIINKGGPPVILPFRFWGNYLLWEEIIS